MTATSKPRIGFAGAGVMGRPMAHHLLAAGYPLTVHARTPKKVSSLLEAGAALATTPRQLAAHADIIIGCLLDEAAFHAVYFGDDGLLTAIRANQIIVEHGTHAPRLARAAAARLSACGAELLDIPVTGGPRRADEGTLTAIAGGQADHLDLVRPLVGTYCSQIVHVGPVGAGLELKLVNQLLVSIHVAAAAEAAALIDRFALPAEQSKAVLMSGWAASTMLDYCLPAALTPSDTPSGSTVGGLLAVQDLVADAARVLELDLPVFASAQRLFDSRLQSGAAYHDIAQLARAYDRHGSTGTEGPGQPLSAGAACKESP